MESSNQETVSESRILVSETGHDDKVQALTPWESHGSPKESPMTSTPSTETAQAASSREDNRPPPTSPTPISTQNAPGTLIATLEPYQRPRNKRNEMKRNKDRRVKQLLLMEETKRREPNFPKFYVMKFPRLDIGTKLNVIATDKEIKNKIGVPTKISKLNKDSLLIEVKSNPQGKKLMEIRNITGLEVIVTEHKTMNQCKGTLYSETLSNSTEEELMECLHEQGVIKVERIKRREYGELVDTHRYILTFNRTELPSLIRLTDWHHEPIDLYIPPPLRCNRCQRLSHTKKFCSRTETTCSSCGTDGHTSHDCQNELHCVNCDGDHSALDKQCPLYQFKCEVIATHTRLRIPFGDAEAMVKEKYRQENKTYSFKVRSRTNRIQSQEQTRINGPQSSQQPSSSSQTLQPSQTLSSHPLSSPSQLPSPSQTPAPTQTNNSQTENQEQEIETLTVDEDPKPVKENKTPQLSLTKDKAPTKEVKKPQPKTKSEKPRRDELPPKETADKAAKIFPTKSEKPIRRMSLTSRADDLSDKDIPKIQKERKFSLTTNPTHHIHPTNDPQKEPRGRKRGGDQLSPDLGNFKIPRKPPPPPPTEPPKNSIPVINSRFQSQGTPHPMNTSHHYYSSQ